MTLPFVREGAISRDDAINALAWMHATYQYREKDLITAAIQKSVMEMHDPELGQCFAIAKALEVYSKLYSFIMDVQERPSGKSAKIAFFDVQMHRLMLSRIQYALYIKHDLPILHCYANQPPRKTPAP